MVDEETNYTYPIFKTYNFSLSTNGLVDDSELLAAFNKNEADVSTTLESKFKELEIFLWHSNNHFWLAIPNETLSVNLSYPDDEFWNYESLYHYTKDEIISKTIVKGISTYYKEII